MQNALNKLRDYFSTGEVWKDVVVQVIAGVTVAFVTAYLIRRHLLSR